MVKAGIYLLLRIGIVFSFTPIFGNTLIIFGTITMLIGSISAVFLKDLKGILAYSTISQLGMMTLMIGIANLGLYNDNHYVIHSHSMLYVSILLTMQSFKASYL